MARMKHGARIPNGAYLEIEVDRTVWRITRSHAGVVTFEALENGEYYEVKEPPAGIMRIWELCEGKAQGSGPH